MKNLRKKSATKRIQENILSIFSNHTLKSVVGILMILTVVLMPSCQKDDIDPLDSDNIVPPRFKVDIPQSISKEIQKKSSQVDTLMGNDIYEHLRSFIHVGEAGAEITEDIMIMIAVNNLNRPLELTIISDDDGRAKHISIVENIQFENKMWQYRMTVTDVEDSQAKAYETDIALQVFWNLDPIDGISILNWYNMNRNTEEEFKDTFFRIDYSETGSLNYDKHMIVSITGMPVPPPEEDIYGITKLKMFVGKSGDQVDLYGNTLHPNAQFFSEETGFNWAFAASASESLDIAVAEVGLPPMALNADDRYTLLEEYSIENVLRNQILLTWPTIDEGLLDDYLYHTQAPGYFNSEGFVQGGTAPSGSYEVLEAAIQNLAPYNPANILALDIQFDE